MEKILLGHGSGGRLMHQLIKEYFAPEFDLKELNDSAVINFYDSPIHPFTHSPIRLAFTTDSYVVSPIFFPGGNIGELAVNGTVNDLSMVGAVPLHLSVGFILEEGFPINDLKKILSSMAAAAKNANVTIVAGDTKVVDKGKGDGIFINTSGVGIIHDGINLSPKNIKAGDKIIVSGFIGSHGIAVLSERNGLSFEPPVMSDTAPLNGLVEMMLGVANLSSGNRGVKGEAGGVRMMRDPTRGGVATTLKEMADDSGLCITVYEESLPISSGVRGACELLGLDPLYVANEGILIAIVSADVAEPLINEMKKYSLGKDAAVIGEVSDSDRRTRGMVLLKTAIGGTRIIDMLAGEQLPRIC
ncbi:MAG: hydrogenase expression/formation protein HypE [Nitrospiraceae bacterium]|nr:hydrogenase expression/formation protein HypE [Nitrospirota bacterium]MDA8338767.1 hydrogenase expression/formation protein HypE [Nitrospiraceae bacterium]